MVIATSIRTVPTSCGTALSTRRSTAALRCVGPSVANSAVPVRSSIGRRVDYPAGLEHGRRSIIMAAEGSGSSADEDDDLLPIERELAKRKPKKRVKVVAPAVEEARGERPVSPASEFEANVLSVLSFLGALVLILGVFLAASGFLPEEIDNFAANVLYPAYTPFVGVFLTCSTAYGVWKSRQ